jgi:hypothetical protein
MTISVLQITVISPNIRRLGFKVIAYFSNEQIKLVVTELNMPFGSEGDKQK